jgi:branched-chain amino acid transport system substrate-binding protein
VIAHLNSGVSIAAAPVYAKAGVPQLAISTKPEYTQLGHATALRLVANDDTQALAMARFVTGTLSAKTVAAIDDGTAYGRSLMEGAVADLKATAGVRIVHRLTVTDTTVDFSALVRRIMIDKVDVIVVTLSDFQGEALLTQMMAAGLKDIPVVGADTFKTPRLQKARLDGATVYATTPIVGVDEFLAGKAFMQSFKARFGSEPFYAAHYAFDAVHLVTDALRRNGSLDRARLLHRLKTSEGMAPVTSHLRFNEQGEQVSGAVGIYLLRKGNWDLQMRSGKW